MVVLARRWLTQKSTHKGRVALLQRLQLAPVALHAELALVALVILVLAVLVVSAKARAALIVLGTGIILFAVVGTVTVLAIVAVVLAAAVVVVAVLVVARDDGSGSTPPQVTGAKRSRAAAARQTGLGSCGCGCYGPHLRELCRLAAAGLALRSCWRGRRRRGSGRRLLDAPDGLGPRSTAVVSGSGGGSGCRGR